MRMRTAGKTAAPVLEFVDPDVVRIIRYLGGELSLDEIEAIENRLNEDDEFFEKAYPFIVMKETPIDFDAIEREIAEEAKANVVEQAPLSVAEPPAVSVVNKPSAPRRSVITTLRRWGPMPIAAAAMLITTAAVGLLMLDPGLQHDAAQERLARSGAFATASDTRTIEMSNMAFVSMRPNAYVGYREHEPARTLLARFVPRVREPRTLTAWLTGSADMMAPADAGITEVVMTAGTARLEADGQYEFRSPPPYNRTTVTVRRGRATLTPADPNAGVIVLEAGQSATMVAPGAWSAVSDSSSHQPPTGARR